jgi:flagellin
MAITPTSYFSAGLSGYNQSQQLFSQSAERLSTGLRINRGSDDPAGLVASEALGARIAELDSLIVSNTRTNHTLAIQEGELAADPDPVSTVEQRAAIGMEQRANESANRAMETERINTIRAQSQIRDADIARESSEMMRAQILGEASIRVMLIGREQGQNVLDLLA